MVHIFKVIRSNCSNHRTTSLVLAVGNVLASIMLHCLTQAREGNIREQYTGLHSDPGCIDQYFTLWYLFETYQIHRLPTVIAFPDL